MVLLLNKNRFCFKVYYKTKRLRLLMLCLAFLTIGSFSYAQEKFDVKGVIKDSQSGELLFSAAVKVEETGDVVTAGFDGDFALKLPKGEYHLKVVMLGYKEYVKVINVTGDMTVSISIESDSIELEEVTIVLEPEDENVKSVEIGVQELDIEEVKKIPPLLGEVDVVKSLELLPGVTTAGEGASGFNVRGGTIDQNLILLDYAPIYSSSHLFGFFSVFNSDAIKGVKLYKGGIPAEWGGRISSVLDVRQTSGNRDSAVVKGGLGVVSGRLMGSTPIDSGRGSVLVAARRSWADVFLVVSNDEDLSQTKAFFYDFNFKGEYDLGRNDKIALTGYYGRDVFGFGDNFRFDWGNGAVSGVWTHSYSDKLVSDIDFNFSNYGYGVGSGTIFQVKSNVRNYGANARYEYYAGDKHTIKFGFNSLFYDVNPGEISGDNLNDGELETEKGLEFSPYISDEFKATDKFTLLYGLRFSSFMNYGPKTVRSYEEGQPRTDNTVSDVKVYGKGELAKYYWGIEPRLALNYSIDSVSSLKAGYNRTKQYIHLISNSSNGLPIDVWKLSDQNIKPVVGDQVSAGYFRNFKENTFEASAEVYYKSMRDVLDYKNGADLIYNDNIETEIVPGNGRSYGLELFVKKKKGKLTGWLSYTLSRSQRKTNADNVNEIINNNEWYAANYDKPHDVSLVMVYEVSKRVTVASNFQYATGKAVSIPDSKYLYEGISTPNVSTRNGTRMSDYHRLDLSLTLYPKRYKQKKFNSYWVFSIYNVYGRQNPYSYSFRPSEDDPSVSETYQLSVLGTVLPAVTFNFEF